MLTLAIFIITVSGALLGVFRVFTSLNADNGTSQLWFERDVSE
jgi:hypothetical protein